MFNTLINFFYYVNIYMNNKDSIFINLLKKHTNIDIKFINTFFKKFKIGGELDFDIKDEIVSDYLNVTLDNISYKINIPKQKNLLKMLIL